MNYDIGNCVRIGDLNFFKVKFMLLFFHSFIFIEKYFSKSICYFINV